MTDDTPPWMDEPNEAKPIQYVVVRFSSRDRRTYTYHNDGPPVAPGDEVRIPGRQEGDGWKAVEVVDVHFIKPPFATKAILQELPDNAS